MAATSDDALGELYGLDSTIDEMYERGVDHAAFDEDEALEAYEEIIQVGAAANAPVADSVLSLAAQLLTKHFAKFPHVHVNVVDVLLALCAASRPQAVRIHSVRSLLQIVKSGLAPPLAHACRERIQAVVATLLQTEPSNVLVRHLTQLQDALAALNDALVNQENKDKRGERREQAQLKNTDTREQHAAKQAVNRDKHEQRHVHDAATRTEQQPTTRDAERRRDDHARDAVAEKDDRSRLGEQRTGSGSSSGGNHRANDTSKPLLVQSNNSNTTTTNTNAAPGCPPSAYIFVGSVPRDTSPRDIINYLSCIDESIDASRVQIKLPSHRGGSAYAFVGLESVDHARKAIRHIETTEFRGRKLIGDFARGPPCTTLHFVERDRAKRIHDVDAFPLVNFAALETSVWDELCTRLKRYGSVEVVRLGCVRFRDLDSAKAVTRLPSIRVQGHEFLCVYDPDEQAQIDALKRRPRSSSGGDVERERRGSDLSRYGARPAEPRAADRRDSRECNRHSLSDDDKRRRRSVSPDRRESRDKPVRRDAGTSERRHESRYGPREAPRSATRVHDREAREQSPNGRRALVDASARRSRSRSRSRSPLARDATNSTNARGRSRSPVRRRTSDESRKRTDDHSPRGANAQLLASRGSNSERNSPRPRSRQDSPPRRGAPEIRRSRSPPASRRDQFERKYGRLDGSKVSSPPFRGRSRSPRRVLSPPQSRRDEPTHTRSRSRSPARDEEPPCARRHPVDEPRSLAAPEHDMRQHVVQPRGHESERDSPRGRRENDAPKMTKYGTVKGAARSPPLVQAARVERGRSRDGNRFTPGRADDRRSSPPRYQADDRNGRHDRRRSPPRSPRAAPHNRDRPGDRRSAARSHSPPRRMAGQKRERSRSPQRQLSASVDGDRHSRADKRDAERDQEQRQPNRVHSPDRRRQKTEERPRETEKPETGKRIRGETEPPPRKHARESTQQRSPPPSPLLWDKRQRSVSPVPSPRAAKPTPDVAVVATQPKHESPRAVPPSRKTAATTTLPSIYDIDECMVDYEEDDD